MNTVVEPGGIAPPAANYAPAVLISSATRWLHTSGIVPIAPDGTVPADVAGQARQVWSNIGAILGEASMPVAYVVAVTTYVAAGTDLAPVMAERDRFMGGHLAASTLVIVPALARPEWLVEIAVVAAA